MKHYDVGVNCVAFIKLLFIFNVLFIKGYAV